MLDLDAAERRDSLIVAGQTPIVDLAPMIVRERLIIEGYQRHEIRSDDIVRYLDELSTCCEMTVLLEPVTHKSERYGWAGWIHWETSGAHFYAWEQPVRFFSVDIYACKRFDPVAAVELTADFFSTRDIVAKTFS